jgi:hypothetical protein
MQPETITPGVVPVLPVSSNPTQEPAEEILVETVGGRAPSVTSTPSNVDADIQQSVNQLLGALPSMAPSSASSETVTSDGGGGLRPPTPPTMSS